MMEDNGTHRRSGLGNPLSTHYDGYDEMNRDADSQLNISGESFHLYIFKLGDDLDCTQMKHVTYKADDKLPRGPNCR
jgi:hypothetical protein